MAPLHSLDTWSTRSLSQHLEPRSKCFLIGEGANTEFWYLEALSKQLAQQGKPELIELKPVERTERHRNQSSPVKLVEHAREIREDKEGIHGFNVDTDRIVVIFDADIYQNNSEQYTKDLEEISKVAQVAVTYPSFEVFLLLHVEDGFQNIIKPNAVSIVNNERAPQSKRRFVEKLASDTFGINVKRNPAVGQISARFAVAVEEEKNVNQDPKLAIGTITSNIGKALAGVIEEGALQYP